MEGKETVLNSAECDCIILDIILPMIDGLTLLRKLRAIKKTTPVLLLTARDSVDDKVVGLDSGADDYLTKPFSFDELLARIRVLLRRQTDLKETVLTLGDLSMDTISREVKRGSKIIELTSKEYSILEYFLRNKNRVLTKTQIAEHVWNYDFEYSSNIVEVYVRYLRRKIDEGHHAKLIHTIRGGGGQRWAIYDKSIVVSGETLGYIRVGRSLQETIYALGNLKTILFISVPLYIILASIGGFFLADRALRPIDYITKTARDISRSHLSKRLQMPKTEDEVGRLSTTFNEMLDRLEASFKKERQFTSDASHELRTPVAIISAQAEQGLSLLKNKQNKECTNAFISIQAECRKMSYLISQLLMLNKSDEGKYELNLEILDLNLIAEEVANEFKSLASKKEIEIIFNSQDNILINADQTLITRMLINLVDNATRYTQSGGNVEISLSKENDSAIIKVSDTGKGI